MKTTLETPRLIMRRWRQEDLEPFAALNADPEVMRFLPKLLSREESDARVAEIEADFERRGFGLWALELKESGEMIGFTGLNAPSFVTAFTPCIEVGWRLARAAWGHGYATEAAKRALDFAFHDLSATEVLSFTVPDNIRSRRVMERLGMTHDPSEIFDHPLLAEGHPLRRHVLYRLQRSDQR